MRRKIYAHWLDPDYLGKLVFSPDLRISQRHQFEGFLKMHALIGDCICISDVQLIESSLLLLLFADQGFRTFIAAHRDFLTLHATPTDRFGATWPRLKSVCSGMARILGFGRPMPRASCLPASSHPQPAHRRSPKLRTW